MRTIVKKAAITGAILSTLVFAPLVAHAATDTEATTINAIIGSTISVTTSGTVNLNVTPIVGGSQTSAADTVTVATNNSTGYALTLSNTDTSLTLTNGGNTIAAHTGSQAAPTALANNSWGYHVDSVGGFDADGAAESNVSSSTIKYAGVPSSAGPNTLKTTSGVTSGDATTVYYAVKADTSKPNGTYADTVTYTATTNP